MYITVSRQQKRGEFLTDECVYFARKEKFRELHEKGVVG